MSFPMPQYPPLTLKDQQAAQALLDDADFEHWRVVLANGTAGDPRSYYRAERQGVKAEVIHGEPQVLLDLVREVERRSPSTATEITSGLSASTGGSHG
jgi:hypothetical protein